MKKLFLAIVMLVVLVAIFRIGGLGLSTSYVVPTTARTLTDLELVQEYGQLINSLGCYRVFINETLGDYLAAEEGGSCPGYYGYAHGDIDYVANLIRKYILKLQ